MVRTVTKNYYSVTVLNKNCHKIFWSHFKPSLARICLESHCKLVELARFLYFYLSVDFKIEIKIRITSKSK
jgi:hypothetical protein